MLIHLFSCLTWFLSCLASCVHANVTFCVLLILYCTWVGTKTWQERRCCFAVFPFLKKCSGIFCFNCSCIAVLLLWYDFYNVQSLQSTTLLCLCLNYSHTSDHCGWRFLFCSFLSVVIHALNEHCHASLRCDATALIFSFTCKGINSL